MQPRWDDLIGTPVASSTFAWNPRTVALYHLGVGVDPHDERGLDYLLDDRLHVLPTFATLACFPVLIHLDELPGLAHIDLARVLHGSHALSLNAAIRTAGTVRTDGEVVAVAARRSNLHVTVEQRSRTADGAVAWTNRYTMVCRGAAGETDADTDRSRTARNEESTPVVEAQVDRRLAANLAHLYRQSGDDNPLHTDPDYARRGGFDRPILHGLCTLGVATRAVIDTMLDGRPDGIRGVEVRFTDVVVPGTTLTTAMGRLGQGIAFSACVGARTVLDRGLIRTV